MDGQLQNSTYASQWSQHSTWEEALNNRTTYGSQCNTIRASIKVFRDRVALAQVELYEH